MQEFMSIVGSFYMQAGVLTLVTSLIGVIIASRHARVLAPSRQKLARAIKWVLITDGFVYGITFLFGMWTVFQWSFRRKYY